MRKTGRSGEASVQLQAAEEENQRRRNASMAASEMALGTALIKSGEFAAAEARLREAVRLSPDDSLTHYNYGLALLLGEKHDDAIAQFRITLHLQPDDPDTLYYLGRAYLKKHEPGGGSALVAAGRTIESAGRAPAERARRGAGRNSRYRRGPLTITASPRDRTRQRPLPARPALHRAGNAELRAGLLTNSRPKPPALLPVKLQRKLHGARIGLNVGDAAE